MGRLPSSCGCSAPAVAARRGGGYSAESYSWEWMGCGAVREREASRGLQSASVGQVMTMMLSMAVDGGTRGIVDGLGVGVLALTVEDGEKEKGNFGRLLAEGEVEIVNQDKRGGRGCGWAWRKEEGLGRVV